MKILIANRGEIAVRIIRAAHEMNIETVAVYAKAEEDALHVKLADEAYCIGEKHSSESYLNMENILMSAVLSGANLVHPGYGFLSENPTFRKLLRECSIGFIGPSEETMLQMGDKSMAKALANGVEKKLINAALTKGTIYPIVKSTASWFGKKMTKDVFAGFFKKTIPVVGGVLGGGITFITFKPCCDKLKASLQDTLLSNPNHNADKDENIITIYDISAETI